MKQKWIIGAVLCLLVLAMTACTTAIPTQDTNAFNTIVAQNVQLTQLAGTLTAVAQQPSLEPATNTPAVQATETLSPQVTNTTAAVREGIWLSFTENTNCRFGPGTSYYLVKTFTPSDQVQAVGRSEDGLYIYVKYTDISNHYCWLPKQLSTFSGDLDRLPAITPMPTNTPTITPTSAAGFALSFNGISNCAGEYYARVLVKNTGFLTWQSIKITVKDNTTGDSVTENSDDFTSYGACAIDQQQGDLSTGEPGIVSNFSNKFAYDLDNHSLTITVTVYSENGLSGLNATQSITVTP